MQIDVDTPSSRRWQVYFASAFLPTLSNNPIMCGRGWFSLTLGQTFNTYSFIHI